MLTGPEDSKPRSVRTLSRWGRFAVGVAASGLAFVCMETIVWATYSALDQKNFDILQTFARPFVAFSNAAAVNHAAHAAEAVVATRPATGPTYGAAYGPTDGPTNGPTNGPMVGSATHSASARP